MKTKLIITFILGICIGMFLLSETFAGRIKTIKINKLKLAAQSIGETHLKDNAVGNLRIILNDLITGEKIKNETLKNEDIASDANISYTKLDLSNNISTDHIKNGTLKNEDISASTKIDLNKLDLTNLPNPTDNEDPATKQYVDNQLSTNINNLKWKDPVTTFSSLPTCNNSSDGHSRLVTEENWIYRCDDTDDTWHKVANVATVNHNVLQNRDAASAHPATSISFSPSGTLSSTNVQTALAELDQDVIHIGSPSTGQILISNGTAWNNITISGDATLSSDGTLTVSNDSHSHTSTTLPIDTSYLGQTIESSEITDGTITGADLKSDISVSTSGNITTTGNVNATEVLSNNFTSFRNGGEREGDYFCQKKTVSDAGLRGGWSNINTSAVCGFNKRCENGSCITTDFACGTSQVTDAENNIYDTVLINDQCWLKQNLKLGTKLASGATMPTNNGTIEKWCYNNDDANCTAYGGLYHWDEAMQYSTTEGARGICPTGWHIPTDAQQYALENYLKDSGQTCDASRVNAWDCSTAGTKLKSGGSSNFTGLLAGLRGSDDSFFNLGAGAYFWSSSQSGSSAWRRDLDSGYATVFRYLDSEAHGFSVRCLKD